MSRWKKVARIGLPIAIGLLAFVLLYLKVRKYHWHELRDSVAQIGAGRVWLCAGLTAINYLILIGYDVLAVRAIGQKLSWRRIALASFAGFTVSYNFGALLGGSSVRYRLYSAWGLPALDIVRLVVMLGVTFWVGVFALAGVVFLIEPLQTPPEISLPVDSTRVLGGIFLLVALGYLALSRFWQKPIRIRDTEVRLPGPGVAIVQIGVSALDLIVMAACLYALLPTEVSTSFPQFLGMFLLAEVAVVLTHVPGGVGVLESVMLYLAAEEHEKATLAALLVFRAVFFLIPLLLAVILLAMNEVRLRNRRNDEGRNTQ